MIRWMAEITKEQDAPEHIIGGQIWHIDRRINIDKIRNLLNIVGKIDIKYISDDEARLAHMTTLRNECVRRQDNTNLIRVMIENYNNNEEMVKQWINEIAEVNRQPKESEIEEWAIKLLDILRHCSSRNKALYLKRSLHFNKDMSIESINNMIQYLANSEALQNKWDEELDKYKLLPNYPSIKRNFILCDTEITTKDGNIIYYNAYTACQHNNIPCDECLLSGTRNLRRRKEFISNLFCR